VLADPRRGGSGGHLWLLLPAAALAALWLSWRALALVDFGYPVFYDALDIAGHIDTFGPQNRFKSGFESTTRAERLRLFGEIVGAIHDGGAGLDAIRYHGPDGRPIDLLLRAPEVGHLQDVANLVSRLAPAGWLAVAWAGIHLLLIRRRGWRVPRLRHLLGASLLVTAACVAVVVAIGPRRVFYWMHELVFPPDHPWFFYYQDSLMSTMMKAPDLFAAIAALLLIIALMLYAALLALAGRLSPG
jgi:hypothetical protein